MGRALAALGVLLFATAPLAAQDAPWCVRLDAFTQNCAFATYNECMAVAATANGPATGASSCVRNPDYKAPPATANAKPAAAKAAKAQH
jgi:hypothetical protein